MNPHQLQRWVLLPTLVAAKLTFTFLQRKAYLVEAFIVLFGDIWLVEVWGFLRGFVGDGLIF